MQYEIIPPSNKLELRRRRLNISFHFTGTASRSELSSTLRIWNNLPQKTKQAR